MILGKSASLQSQASAPTRMEQSTLSCGRVEVNTSDSCWNIPRERYTGLREDIGLQIHLEAMSMRFLVISQATHNMKLKPVAFAPSDRHNCHSNCIRNFNANHVGGLTGCYASGTDLE